MPWKAKPVEHFLVPGGLPDPRIAAKQRAAERREELAARAAMAKAERKVAVAKKEKAAESLFIPAIVIEDDPSYEELVEQVKTQTEIPDEIPEKTLGYLNLGAAEIRRIRELIAAKIRRRNESLRLWVPMENQRAFHECTSYERTVIGSNRSGKTTAAAVDVAWIVTGQHPKLSGTHLPKEGGTACVVGFDWDHIGRVIYEKLFVPGAFRIIRDEITHRLRPYNPANDEHRKGESTLAPPLIPKRMIKKIAWKSKALNQIKLCVLKNGWKIKFFSSEGEPPQGDSYDLMWFDEEIQKQSWYTEGAMRLVDNEGYFVWSATPHVGGDDLIDLHNRSIDEVGKENPTTSEFHLTLFGNMHLTQRAKDLIVEKYKNRPDDYRVRVLGEFAAKAYKVYPEFSKSIHGFSPKKVWDKTGGQVPHDWCKYAVVDPGRQVCAVLFIAVPPPELGQCWYVYDELYITNSTPQKFALEVERKTADKTFECFIMDMHAGRSRQISGGKSVEEQYHDALLKTGSDGTTNVWQRFRQPHFWPGADDVSAGIDEVRSCLYIDSVTAIPRLQVIGDGRVPMFEKEIDRYSYRKVDGKMTDKPKDKWNHLMDCLRYICSFRPTWVMPKPVPKRKSAAVLRFEEKKRRAKREQGGTVRFGPGSNKRAKSA